MSWFNYYGLVIFAVLMAPNVAYMIKNKGSFENRFSCKALEIAEQIGRYGSFLLLIFNIPYTYKGFFFDGGEVTYLAVNGAILLCYLSVWVIMWKKANVLRAVLLSVLPSLIFVFSGIMIISIPLMAASLLFAATHITISVKNAVLAERAGREKA